MAVLGVLPVLLAGCGGSHLYTLDKTQRCLRAKHVRLGSPTDFVASSATGGATRVILVGNRATIVFGATQSDADGIADEYRRVAAANVGIDDVLAEVKNAVLLWHAHPSDAQLALITGCLK